MTERITGIVNRLATAEDYNSIAWILGNPVENIALSVVDDTQRENIEMQTGAGLTATVTRYTQPSGDKWPCPFCEALEGTYTYPDVPADLWRRHENCRCVIEYTSAKTGKTDYLRGNEYNGRPYGSTKWVKVDPQTIKTRTAFEAVNTEAHVVDKTATVQALEAENIKARAIKDLPNPLTEEEIVAKIGGQDRTHGSCASIAHTYIGNKKGWDVLDFRGGKSQKYFSSMGNQIQLFEDIGVKPTIVADKDDIKAGQRLLSTTKEGHEYFLGVGRHGAIVRKTSTGYDYLELQGNADVNGWHAFTGTDDMGVKNTLITRFGCDPNSALFAPKNGYNNIIVDIDDIPASDDYKEILSHLNTTEKAQRKGAGGGIK